MSYAICSVIEELSGDQMVVEVCCARCFASLGTMTAQTLMRALARHNTVLCPPCRSLCLSSYSNLNSLQKPEGAKTNGKQQ
jgi:hypothetical protein